MARTEATRPTASVTSSETAATGYEVDSAYESVRRLIYATHVASYSILCAQLTRVDGYDRPGQNMCN